MVLRLSRVHGVLSLVLHRSRPSTKSLSPQSGRSFPDRNPQRTGNDRGTLIRLTRDSGRCDGPAGAPLTEKVRGAARKELEPPPRILERILTFGWIPHTYRGWQLTRRLSSVCQGPKTHPTPLDGRSPFPVGSTGRSWPATHLP